ncbi:MAG: saccharopine dehydrogenase NADP-binding domain-containing protein, partial [Actinomycetales bacterium]|nr:saccharopine dehydrogenase NADP-binding domain-containing protein [Actinomycetales bacterium]
MRTSMKALIIGAGGVGSAIANIASRRSFLTQVIIADHDKQRAENAVARLNGDPRFTAAQVDASQVQAVEELLRAHRPDVVINAVDPRFVMPIFLACEYEEVNYVDMAMS